MKKGDLVELNVYKTLRQDQDKDNKICLGVINEYDAKQEVLWIVLQEGSLVELSLDAIYRCTIQSDNGKVWCTGRVQERYCSQVGNCFAFHIENGFYKININ